MKTIWKFQLNGIDREEVKMPSGARVLTAQQQRGVICAWAVVDPKEKEVKRAFYIVGTGHPMPTEDVEYIGTVKQAADALIWHVFVSSEQHAR